MKEKRKRIQEQNKQRKEEEKQVLKEKSLKGMQKGRSETDLMMQKVVNEANAEDQQADDDDKEYYREEVGEEPDEGCFLKVFFVLIYFISLFPF